MAKELLKYDNRIVLSNFIDILDIAMIGDDKNWKKHYEAMIVDKVVNVLDEYFYAVNP